MRGVSLACCLSLVLGATSVSSAQPPAKNPVVVMETSMGTVKIELYPDKAPDTVKNFLNYVEKKHFDGLIFHRVMKDFMIQGGGYGPGMVKEKQTDPPIRNEAKDAISNTRGTIAMARTHDPHSATAQFFINVVDNSYRLDHGKTGDGWGYTAFGKVTEGMDVVDKIKMVDVKDLSPAVQNVPVQDVVIKSIRKAS
jgi:cyclophilin family peptidyl-prolyl cis-trans isomerase